MRETINDELTRRFYDDRNVTAARSTLEESVRQGTVSPFAAAHELLDLFFAEQHHSE